MDKMLVLVAPVSTGTAEVEAVGVIGAGLWRWRGVYSVTSEGPGPTHSNQDTGRHAWAGCSIPFAGACDAARGASRRL
jgi:hypothetical protein